MKKSRFSNATNLEILGSNTLIKSNVPISGVITMNREARRAFSKVKKEKPEVIERFK